MTTDKKPPGRGPGSLTLALLLTGLGLLAAGLGIVAILLVDEDPVMIFKDMAALVGTNPFAGFYSVVGVGMWVASGAIALFGAALLYRYSPGPAVGFLTFFGLLTLAVAIDDQFMLHEWGLARLPGPGQPVYMVVYGVALLAFLFTQRALLRSEHLPLFLFAAAFLAGSVVLDNIGDLFGVKPEAADVGEDVLKFVGALLWSAYGVLRSYGFLTDALTATRDAKGPRRTDQASSAAAE